MRASVFRMGQGGGQCLLLPAGISIRLHRSDIHTTTPQQRKELLENTFQHVHVCVLRKGLHEKSVPAGWVGFFFFLIKPFHLHRSQTENCL